jgi:hypothetical protein
MNDHPEESSPDEAAIEGDFDDYEEHAAHEQHLSTADSNELDSVSLDEA